MIPSCPATVGRGADSRSRKSALSLCIYIMTSRKSPFDSFASSTSTRASPPAEFLLFGSYIAATKGFTVATDVDVSSAILVSTDDRTPNSSKSTSHLYKAMIRRLRYLHHRLPLFHAGPTFRNFPAILPRVFQNHTRDATILPLYLSFLRLRY